MNYENMNKVDIDAYIAKHGLKEGAILPVPREIAAELKCEESAVIEAVECLAQEARVTQKGEHWVVGSRESLDHEGFSFRTSAQAHGDALETRVVELAIRRPFDGAQLDNSYFDCELIAHEELGLAGTDPFLVIARVRVLKSRPSVIHRAYLNPARFPKEFQKEHDFSRESLIDVYKQYGYTLLSRDTVLEARIANFNEINILTPNYKKPYQSEPRANVVLDAEQKLWATHPPSDKPFVLEFLKATYIEHWKYGIKNRPAS